MAVPAKDDTEEKSPYIVNKVLYDEANGIKEQMKLIHDRLDKMEAHRSEVSDSVYLKVKSDYGTQLDAVQRSFDEKSQEINHELTQLYQAQKEQEAQLETHQEVLEEAKFRHLLSEYNDKKFKELEIKQNKEISKFNDILGIIKASIQQYEEILGHPFEAGIKTEKQRRPEPAKAPPPPPPSASKIAKAPAPLKDEDTQKTSTEGETTRPKTEAPPPPAAEKKKEEKPGAFEEKLSEDLDMFLQSEGDYFTEESESLASEAAAQNEEAASAPSSAAAKPSSTPPVSKTKPVDDSISTILRDIPVDEEPSEVMKKMSGGDTSAKMDISEFPLEASLLLIEGELDEHEYVLGENTSIGRSPSNDVVLRETKVSRQHASINFTNGDYVLVDLKSSNGVFVNGKKVEEAILNDGDEISVGSFKFQFNLA